MRTFDADVKSNQWKLNTKIKSSNSVMSTLIESVSGSSQNRRDEKNKSESKPVSKPERSARPSAFEEYVSPQSVSGTVLSAIMGDKPGTSHSVTVKQEPPSNNGNSVPSDLLSESVMGPSRMPLYYLQAAYILLALISSLAIPVQLNRGPKGVLVLLTIYMSVISSIITFHAYVAWQTKQRISVAFAFVFLFITMPAAHCYMEFEEEYSIDSRKTRSNAHWGFFFAFLTLAWFYSATFTDVITRYLYSAAATLFVLFPLLYIEFQPSETGEVVVICFAFLAIFTLAFMSTFRLSKAWLESSIVFT